MNERRYNSRIELNDNFLDVEVEYESAVTKEEYEHFLDYFQWRASKIEGREIKEEEIEIEPKEGELRSLTTRLRVSLDDDLSERLKILVKENYVYGRLIEDLERYKERNELSERGIRLINYAIKEVWNSLR